VKEKDMKSHHDVSKLRLGTLVLTAAAWSFLPACTATETAETTGAPTADTMAAPVTSGLQVATSDDVFFDYPPPTPAPAKDTAPAPAKETAPEDETAAIETTPPPTDAGPTMIVDESMLVTAPWPKSNLAFPGPGELLRAEMGQPPRASLLDGAPGRKKDPEAAALQRGRRIVLPQDETFQFTGKTFESPEAVAQAILDELLFDRYEGLLGLSVSREDYDRFFWPEFPQSRPITNMQSGDGWMFHDADCRDAVKGALSAWGGQEFVLAGVNFTEGIAQYANFNLLHGVVIHAVSEGGQDVFMTFAPVFAERNGRWKVYQYNE
jgi:hypothetical protein